MISGGSDMEKTDNSKYIKCMGKFMLDGKEYEYPIYDTSTPEGKRAWIDATAGSIDDDTFVRPVDFYEDFYNKHKDEILSRQ